MFSSIFSYYPKDATGLVSLYRRPVSRKLADGQPPVLAFHRADGRDGTTDITDRVYPCSQILFSKLCREVLSWNGPT